MNSTVATRATEIVLPGKVEPGGLQVRSRDLPAPAAGQVMLRMDATGVSFAEQQMRRGKYYDQPSFPFVSGYDVVGTVTAVGPDVDPAMTGTGSSRSPRPAAGPAPCCSTPRTWLPCRTA